MFERKKLPELLGQDPGFPEGLNGPAVAVKVPISLLKFNIFTKRWHMRVCV